MRRTRRVVQLGFVALTLLGVYAFAGHAERWCPFGGVEAAYNYFREGNLICSLGVSNFYILAAVVVMTLLLRRAFCGYACPIGALSEWLQSGARRLGLRARTVPYGLDRALALLKYVVLAVILYCTWTIGELVFRGYDPCYALISRHGTDITLWAYVIAGAIGAASLLVIMPFCRWLCPLAAVLSPFARVGLARVKRDPGTCLDCGACRRACPMGIRVDHVADVTAARCIGCLECVAACPPKAGGALVWGPPRRLGRRWPQAVLVAVLLACVGGAVAATYALPLPSVVVTRGALPKATAQLTVRIAGVNCRHSALRFADHIGAAEPALAKSCRIEVWPAPAGSAVRITYDPAKTDEAAIRAAITEPYFDRAAGRWLLSPYKIEGYSPPADE